MTTATTTTARTWQPRHGPGPWLISVFARWLDRHDEDFSQWLVDVIERSAS